MIVSIKKGTAHGRVSAPPSKSYAHRLLIAAALANGTSTIHHVAFNQDILATIDCLKSLGARVEATEDTVTVTGAGGHISPTGLLACRESGSTLRFIIPVALLSGKPFSLSGTERLLDRGVGLYETLFAPYGMTFERQDSRLNINGELISSQYELPGNVSSQFVSGLLFALPLTAQDSTLRVLPPVESRAYIDITLHVLRLFGIVIEEPSPNTFFIPGGQAYCPRELTVEGDWSNAAFLLALNSCGGQVKVDNLISDSVQGDKIAPALLEKLEKDKEPRIDVSGCPDLAPILFAVAAAGHGAIFTGTARLAIKESDRAAAMGEELQKFGIRSEIEANRVRIFPGTLCTPSLPLSGHNDHRIVMALATLATLTGAQIEGAEAVNKSYPDYFSQLSRLGLEVTYGPA